MDYYQSLKLSSPLSYRYLYLDSVVNYIPPKNIGCLLVDKYTIQYTT